MHKWFERRWRSTQKKVVKSFRTVVWNVRVTEGDVISREPLLHERKEWDDVMCEQHVAYYSSIYPALQRIMTKFFFYFEAFQNDNGIAKVSISLKIQLLCCVGRIVWPNLLFFPGWSISAKLFDFVCQVMYSSLVVSLITVASNHFISFSCSYIWRQGGGESDWIMHLSFLRPHILFAPTIARHLDSTSCPSSSLWSFVFWAECFIFFFFLNSQLDTAPERGDNNGLGSCIWVEPIDKERATQ